MKFTIAAVVLALAVSAHASVIGLPWATSHAVYHDDGLLHGHLGSHYGHHDGTYHGGYGHAAHIISPAAHYVAAHQPAHIVSAPGHILAASHAIHGSPHIGHAHHGHEG